MTQFSMFAAAALLAAAAIQPMQEGLAQMNVDQAPAARPAQSHPYVGMWITADGHVRHNLLENGRYDEARGNRESAYQGRYEVRGTDIFYWDDTGFTADGRFVDGGASSRRHGSVSSEVAPALPARTAGRCVGWNDPTGDAPFEGVERGRACRGGWNTAGSRCVGCLMTLARRTLLGLGAGAAAAAIAPATTRAQAADPTKPAAPLDLGGRLFSHVQAYSRWPQHRTGTDEAASTLDWFEASLRERGATTARWEYDFPRYEWRARVEVGGRSVETIPLWFEGDGEIATDEPFVRPVTLPGNFDKRDIELALREAKADKARLAVLPTFGKFGEAQRWPALIACNADPDAVRSDIPTLLVSGRELDALAGGEVHAVMSAKRVPARSPNVIARFGSGANPLVITTPLTGWFTCAGERGSGIAVAIELAAMLAQQEAVTVIGTTGHELEDFGIRRQLEAGLGFTPSAVVHIGASLAAGSRAADGKLEPSAFRFAAATRPMVEGSDLHQALHNGGFTAAPRMLGEGAEWAKVLGPDVPLLSFSGTFQHFRTPADLPEASTAPALLAEAFTTVRDAVKAL